MWSEMGNLHTKVKRSIWCLEDSLQLSWDGGVLTLSQRNQGKDVGHFFDVVVQYGNSRI